MACTLRTIPGPMMASSPPTTMPPSGEATRFVHDYEGLQSEKIGGGISNSVVGRKDACFPLSPFPACGGGR